MTSSKAVPSIFLCLHRHAPIPGPHPAFALLLPPLVLLLLPLLLLLLLPLLPGRLLALLLLALLLLGRQGEGEAVVL
jgi:hypothetical protein